MLALFISQFNSSILENKNRRGYKSTFIDISFQNLEIILKRFTSTKCTEQPNQQCSSISTRRRSTSGSTKRDPICFDANNFERNESSLYNKIFSVNLFYGIW